MTPVSPDHQTCTPHMAEVWEQAKRACEDFGVVVIRLDMEDYGREPGDIAWVNVGEDGRGFGPLCEALDCAIGLERTAQRIIAQGVEAGL